MTKNKLRVVVALATLLTSALVVAAPSTTVVRHDSPGSVVASAPLPRELWLPQSAKAYQVLYSSTGWDDRSTTVSGSVFVPSGPTPRGGWPVVSWAHGTVGIADACAESIRGRSGVETEFLSSWLAKGYAIVATDYEGLGTPGVHTFLHGRSQAYAMIDLVRAAHKVDRTLGAKWLALGHSQGGQAVLFAGAVEHRYAPELDYRGAAAIAPPTRFRSLLSYWKPFVPEAPANPFVLLSFGALERMAPGEFDRTSTLTPLGRELLAAAATRDCIGDLFRKFARLTSAQVYSVDAPTAERLTGHIEAVAEIPIVGHHSPLLLVQGEADTLIDPQATRSTAGDLARAGTPTTYKTYPGADHFGSVLLGARADLLEFTAERLR